MPEVLINGPAGRLEGRYTHGKQPNAPVALLRSKVAIDRIVNRF